MLVHGTCIDLDGAGVLLRGPPGSGKSDLALRMIHGGARLVADDQVDVAAHDGVLVARSPAALAGLLEIRGVGLVTFDALPSTALAMAVELCDDEGVERMPEPEHVRLQGIALPLFRLCALSASAPAELAAALDVVLGARRLAGEALPAPGGRARGAPPARRAPRPRLPERPVLV